MLNEEKKDKKIKRYIYTCFKCRSKLFTDDALEKNQPGHETCATLCFKIDAEHNMIEELGGGGMKGMLSCFKCKYKVGKVCLHGVKCACGKFTTTCRFVVPSKVDRFLCKPRTKVAKKTVVSWKKSVEAGDAKESSLLSMPTSSHIPAPNVVAGEPAPAEEDNSYGYANKSMRKKCECEMCRTGQATSHNDESHDQSLYGKFEIEIGKLALKLNFVGGTTKCGRVMSRFFVNQATKIKIKGKTLLEVGSGAGIVGSVLAHMEPKNIVLTDQAPMVPLLRANLEQLDESVLKRIKVMNLFWSRENARAVLKEVPNFDLIIGSDLIFAKEGIEPLCNVVDEVQKVNPTCVFYIAVIRRFKWEESFFSLMQEFCQEELVHEEGDISIYRYARRKMAHQE